jgi:hypothetical protein
MFKSSIYQHMIARIALTLIVLGVFIQQTVSPALTLKSEGNLPPVKPSRIGAVEAYYREKDADEANLGWERIIFEWRKFQPDSADDWDESSVSAEWLDNANKSGRMVVGLIKNAPNWATGTKLFGSPAKGLKLPIDDPNNLWATFVRKLVQRYSTRYNIHHWIIYNEPDIRPTDTIYFEFAGDVRDYYQTVKVAYKAAHATDPQAVIHVAGLAYWHDVVHNRRLYLDRFLRTAYADPEAKANNYFFDVLTVHVFDNTDYVWYLTWLNKRIPEMLGMKKPVWIDELNTLISSDAGYPAVFRQWPKVSLEQQANFIIQGAALGLAAGAERISIYRLFDDNAKHPGYEAWGLIREDGTRRPGYYALKTASEYFGNADNAQRYKNNSVTLVTMQEAGRTIYVVWNQTTAPVTVRIRAVRTLNGPLLVSAVGKTQTLPDGEVGNGVYDLNLAPCKSPCLIQGEPRILVQPGSPQTVWTLRNGLPFLLKP